MPRMSARALRLEASDEGHSRRQTCRARATRKDFGEFVWPPDFCSCCSVGAQARKSATPPFLIPHRPILRAPAEVRALSGLIRDLQAQVQTLNSQLGDLRTEQERASAEARDLRRELDLVRTQGAPAAGGPLNPVLAAPPARESAAQPESPSSSTPPQSLTTEDRIAKLEESQDVMEGKINDQYQTKVESGSKYRLRLSGIVLLNLFENRGTVDNEDFPSVAESQQANEPTASPATFGGTLRQSQIRLQAFGPDIAGARTSADVNFDFAGGFPDASNGVGMGIVRLRTGVDAAGLDQHIHRRRTGPFVFCRRWLPRRLRPSLFRRCLMPEICGPGRRRCASNIASFCPKRPASPFRGEFSIISRAIFLPKITAVTPPGARNRASRRMPRRVS